MAGRDAQTPTHALHGRVRIVPDHDLSGSAGMSITLGNTEYCMSVDDALGLANRILLTCVDKETRYAE